MKLTRNMPKGKRIETAVTYKCGCVKQESIIEKDIPAYLTMSLKMRCRECYKAGINE